MSTSGSYTNSPVDSVCPKCGKPKYYVGDYFGGPKPWCECPPEVKAPFNTYDPVALYGWVCSKCGRSNAPWVATCPCGPNVTTTTSDGTTFEDVMEKVLKDRHDTFKELAEL